MVDNGPEFRSAALDAWAYQHRVSLEFIQPGKPIQNAVIECYNGRMPDELLNTRWWLTVAEAGDAIVAHRVDYNQVRPHGALNHRTPEESAKAYRASDSGVMVA